MVNGVGLGAIGMAVDNGVLKMASVNDGEVSDCWDRYR